MSGMDGLLPALAPLAERFIAEKYFPGVVVRVKHRWHSWEHAWGAATTEGQTAEALTTRHLFDIASLSKLFTTSAILRLITFKELGEHTLVNEVLGFTDPAVRRMLATVDTAALMTHSSGIRPWFPFYTRSSEPFEAVLAHVAGRYPAETGVAYSDLNYMLLGRMIEKLVDKPLDKSMQDLVFRPLEMKSATYRPDPVRTVATEFGNRIEERMCTELGVAFTGWRPRDKAIRGDCDDGNCFYYFKGVAGHAGIFADAGDLEKLGEVYRGDYPSFINPDVLARATTDAGGGRGYGVQFGELYPGSGFGHTGFTGTYLYVNPQQDFIISILTNRLHVSEPKDIKTTRKELVDAVLNALHPS
jgi:serine-type D-Ala-D-Ala carboxypeptidase